MSCDVLFGLGITVEFDVAAPSVSLYALNDDDFSNCVAQTKTSSETPGFVSGVSKRKRIEVDTSLVKVFVVEILCQSDVSKILTMKN